MRRSNGFTLIELMITLGIIVVMAGIAMPSIVQMRQRALFRQAAADIASMLREARTRTVSRNLEHRVDFTAAQYQLMQGNRSSGSNAWAAVWTATAVPVGVTLALDAGCNPGPPINVDFNTNGTAGVVGVCTISVQNAAAANQYQVTVAQITGQVRLVQP